MIASSLLARIRLCGALAALPAFAALMLFCSPPAQALEGGYVAKASHQFSRSAVAIRSVRPAGAEKMRVSECSGLLIERDIVLTAGHCLDGIGPASHVAVLFFDVATGQALPVRAAAYAHHPAYRFQWWDGPNDAATRQAAIAADVALIRLSGSAPLSAQPVPVASPRGGGSSFVAGTGLDGPTGTAGTTIRIAPLNALRPTASGPSLYFANPDSARACRGDSGAGVAALRNGTLAAWGVVSSILQPDQGCGRRLVITPVDGTSAAFQAMRAALRATN